MRARIGTVLRTLRTADSGQSLVIVSVSMVMMLGMAALGIDVASWYTEHHQTQVVADSAALAAANCLARPNTGPSGASCSSSTDVTDATTVAIAYAAANGVTISASQVNINTTTDKVTINASATAPTLFTKLFGIHTTTQAASAAASWAGSSSACSNPGTGCDFMFADNSNCSSSSNGIAFSMSGNATVNGNIQSNSNLSGAVSGNISLGTATYGPNGTHTCSNSVIYSGHDPWTTPPTQESTDLPWPIDYTKDFPACGGTGELACASNGYPTFCTNEGQSITFTGSGGSGDAPISGNIYCASGTGSPSTPSTWNGTISITFSGNSTTYDSFVGGTISYTVSGNETLSSCGYSTSGYISANCSSSVPSPVTGSYPIFYATGTGSGAITTTISGGQTFNGDFFAPNGGAALTWSGNKTVVGFVEANNISADISGTFNGDGPEGGTTDSGGSATDSLVQ